MNKPLAAAIAVIIIITLAAFGFFYYYQNRILNEDVLPSNLPSPIAKFQLPSPTPSSLSTGAPVIRQPESGESDVVIKKIGITTVEPQDNSTVTAPVIVRGYANVFEGLVQIRIKDSLGNILGSTNAVGCMGEEACPFEAVLMFEKAQTPTGTLEIYSNSPKDGSIENLQETPLRFN